MSAPMLSHGRSLSVSTHESAASPAEALAAVAHTSRVALPSKPVLARGALTATFRTEILTGRREQLVLDRGDVCHLVERAASRYRHFVAPAESRADVARFAADERASLADALTAADWNVPSGGASADPSTTPLRAAPPWASTTLVTVSPGEPGFVRASLSEDVLHAEHADAALVLALFALQAGARLVLARPTLRRGAERKAGVRSKNAADQLLLGWDAVVPVAPSSLERTVEAITFAAAACDFARAHTLASFRALAAAEPIARAYLESDERFEAFRSIVTEATPPALAAQTHHNTEVNEPWTTQSLV